MPHTPIRDGHLGNPAAIALALTPHAAGCSCSRGRQAARDEPVISSDTILILSQDYEVFFHKSGTLERCLFEPCEALLRSARRHGYRITFYIDAGMLWRMRQLAPTCPRLSADLDRVRRHIRGIADAGHDIGLHIHPHWEDTEVVEGRWRFADTRYRLEQFTADEAADIVRRYAGLLGETCGTAPTSYRAGGFCVEPFSSIAGPLLQCGIDVDSSVVPGASLRDDEKGFDFRRAPRREWWRFEDSPLAPNDTGRFLEIPVTPQKLPLGYYWDRVRDRLTGRQDGVFGDGAGKRIGKPEILRRLLGASRVAELSVDHPKAAGLARLPRRDPPMRLCHVMGHPKNLSMKSLSVLENMVESRGLGRFESIASAARLIRAGDLG